MGTCVACIDEQNCTGEDLCLDGNCINPACLDNVLNNGETDVGSGEGSTDGDYGDEWLWRPAMWWRWVPRLTQQQLGRRIAREFLGPLLNAPAGAWFAERQRREWLYRDGVSRRTDGWVRQLYLDELATLQPRFEERPFVLGNQPTWADFGYFGSMFRHFGNDPEPAEIMRREAPAVYEWTARMWRGDSGAGPCHFDASGLEALFARIRGDYLPYLRANADAFGEDRAVFDLHGAHCNLLGTKTTEYRVHCWNALLAQWTSLARTDRRRVEGIVGDLSILETGRRVECSLPDRPMLPIPAGTSFPFRFDTLLGQPRD
jgi:hypothetical protein